MAVTQVTSTVNSSLEPNTQEINTLKVRMTEQEELLSNKVPEITSVAAASAVATAAVTSNTAKQTALETTFEALVINAGSSNAEIVASRGSEAYLPDRLTKVDAQLADNALYGRSYGMVMDGVTDDTIAFRSALADSKIKRKKLIVNSKIRVTDEILIDGAIWLEGIGTTKGLGGLIHTSNTEIVFDNSEVDGGGNAAKCLFRLKESVNMSLHDLAIKDINITHSSSVPNQHSIIIDASNISYSKLNRITFNDMTGYSIIFKGATYSQNLNWSDLTFYRVGGCVGRTSDAALLTVTLCTFTNFNLDNGINNISPQDYIYDFGGMRLLGATNILAEGSLTGITKDITAVRIGCFEDKKSAANSIIDLWIEFNGVKKPTYSIEVIGGLNAINGCYGVVTASPIRVNGDHTHVSIKGLDGYSEDINALVIFDSPYASVEIDGITSKSVLDVPLSKIGKITVKNGITLDGEDKIRYSTAFSRTIYKHTEGFTKNNRFITFNTAGVTTVEMCTDADEGRCLLYKRDINNLPAFGMTINIPPEFFGCSVVVGYRYKIETTDVTDAMALMLSATGLFKFKRVNYNILNGWASGYLIFSDVRQATLLPATNSQAIAAHNLKISDIQVVIGNELPRLFGTTGETQTIETKGVTIPTIGNWLKGDRMVNSNPVVGQPKAWVCTVAGTPGTWVSEGNL